MERLPIVLLVLVCSGCLSVSATTLGFEDDMQQVRTMDCGQQPTTPLNERCVLFNFAQVCTPMQGWAYPTRAFPWTNFSVPHCPSSNRRPVIPPRQASANCSAVVKPTFTSLKFPPQTWQTDGWDGVDCDENERVTGLNLAAFNLECDIRHLPVAQLRHLRGVWVSHNGKGLYGDIADAFDTPCRAPGACESLEVIDVSDTYVSGVFGNGLVATLQHAPLAKLQLGKTLIQIESTLRLDDYFSESLCVISFDSLSMLEIPPKPPLPPQRQFLEHLSGLRRIFFLDLEYTEGLSTTTFPASFVRLNQSLEYLHLTGSDVGGFDNPNTLDPFLKLIDVRMNDVRTELLMPPLNIWPSILHFEARNASIKGVMPFRKPVDDNNSLRVLNVRSNPALTVYIDDIMLSSRSQLMDFQVGGCNVTNLKGACVSPSEIVEELSAAGSSLVRLNVQNAGLCGPLPLGISLLSELTSVVIKDNARVCGPLVSPIGRPGIMRAPLERLDLSGTSIRGCLPALLMMEGLVSFDGRRTYLVYDQAWAHHDPLCPHLDLPIPTLNDLEQYCALYALNSSLFYRSNVLVEEVPPAARHMPSHKNYTVQCATAAFREHPESAVLLDCNYTRWGAATCPSDFFGMMGMCIPCTSASRTNFSCPFLTPVTDPRQWPTQSLLTIPDDGNGRIINTQAAAVQKGSRVSNGSDSIRVWFTQNNSDALFGLRDAVVPCRQLLNGSNSCSDEAITCRMNCVSRVTRAIDPIFNTDDCWMDCINNACADGFDINRRCLECKEGYYGADIGCKPCRVYPVLWWFLPLLSMIAFVFLLIFFTSHCRPGGDDRTRVVKLREHLVMQLGPTLALTNYMVFLLDLSYMEIAFPSGFALIVCFVLVWRFSPAGLAIFNDEDWMMDWMKRAGRLLAFSLFISVSTLIVVSAALSADDDSSTSRGIIPYPCVGMWLYYKIPDLESPLLQRFLAFVLFVFLVPVIVSSLVFAIRNRGAGCKWDEEAIDHWLIEFYSLTVNEAFSIFRESIIVMGAEGYKHDYLWPAVVIPVAYVLLLAFLVFRAFKPPNSGSAGWFLVTVTAAVVSVQLSHDMGDTEAQKWVRFMRNAIIVLMCLLVFLSRKTDRAQQRAGDYGALNENQPVNADANALSDYDIDGGADDYGGDDPAGSSLLECAVEFLRWMCRGYILQSAPVVFLRSIYDSAPVVFVRSTCSRIVQSKYKNKRAESENDAAVSDANKVLVVVCALIVVFVYVLVPIVTHGALEMLWTVVGILGIILIGRAWFVIDKDEKKYKDEKKKKDKNEKKKKKKTTEALKKKTLQVKNLSTT